MFNKTEIKELKKCIGAKAMNENWCAFLIAILKKCTVEQSFLYMKEEMPTDRALCLAFTAEDMKDLIKLKETASIKELSEIYNISESNIYHRISYYKKTFNLAK